MQPICDHSDQNANFQEVERIIDKRLKNDEEEYKIRFKDSSPEEDLWLKEDDCKNCYDLIVLFEASEFESKQKFEPELVKIKNYCNKTKFLVRWKKIPDEQYFYAFVIRLMAPELLLGVYEKLIIETEASSSLDVNNALVIPKRVAIDHDNVAEKIIGIIGSFNQRMYLTAWKNEDELYVVDESTAKLKFPCLLIEFFENYLFSKRKC